MHSLFRVPAEGFEPTSHYILSVAGFSNFRTRAGRGGRTLTCTLGLPAYSDRSNRRLSHVYLFHHTPIFVTPEGLEPSRLSALVPKTSASTNSATGPSQLSRRRRDSNPQRPKAHLFSKQAPDPAGSPPYSIIKELPWHIRVHLTELVLAKDPIVRRPLRLAKHHERLTELFSHYWELKLKVLFVRFPVD